MKREKGEITAFLSLIFVLLVSFILAMTQSAQIQTTKNMKRLAVDKALFSVFGEYHRELLEEYEIFAIDGTYGTGQYEEQQIINRMSYYGSIGIEQSVTDLQFLTDNGGQAFREQVLECMETRKGMEILQDVTGLSAKWEEQKLQGKEVSEQLEQMLPQGEELLPEENQGVLEIGKKGILSLVLPKSFRLSGKYVGKEQQVSSRNRNTGRGSLPVRKGSGNLAEKILFEQYLLEKFNSAVTKPSEMRNLNYEVEYLLAGKEQDEANLKEVVNQLLLVRLGLNYAYLMTDAKKKEEADSLAAALTAIVLQPEAKEILKQLLLLLWSFGESVVDLRVLLSGRKVAMYKDEATWQLSLSEVFTIWTSEKGYEGEEVQEGMDYGQYLQILLHLENVETLNMRTLDRVEQNLRFEKGQEYFRADACITKIKLQNEAELWSGYRYSFPAYFGYL